MDSLLKNNVIDESSSGTTPTDGLIAYYPLNTDSSDETGNYDGTDYNITYDGSSADFNGSNGWIDCGVDTVPTTGDFSISIWARCEEITKNASTVFFIADGVNNNNTNYCLGVTYQVSEIQLIGKTTTGTMNIRTEPATNGKWDYFTVTYTDGDIKLYRDGSLLYSDTRTLINRSNVFQIGWCWYSAYHNGQISNVRVYDKVLSSTEITDLYNEGA
jgi:hypothetical protein